MMTSRRSPEQSSDHVPENLGFMKTASIIADRLSVLSHLEAFVCGDKVKQDRAEIHQILTHHTWLFGESYHLTVEDPSLTEVLRKHRFHLETEAMMDETSISVQRRDGLSDLIIARHSPLAGRQPHHPIVAIKPPSLRA